jgi:putative endopeptidase
VVENATLSQFLLLLPLQRPVRRIAAAAAARLPQPALSISRYSLRGVGSANGPKTGICTHSKVISSSQYFDSSAMLGGQKGPVVPAPMKGVKPAENFYMYVNGRWQNRAHIPPYAGSFGISEEIEEHVRDDLVATIQHQDAKHPLSLLAKSVINPRVQTSNVRDLRQLLQGFQCIRNTDDVGRTIGQLNRIQSRAPITLTVAADAYRSDICRVHVYETTVGLPTRHDYEEEVGGKNKTVLEYASFLRKVGALLEVEGVDQVIPLEKAILPYLSAGDSLRNPEESYAPFTFEALQRRWKNVPWKTILLSWGMPTDLVRDSTFIITNERYVGNLNRMFEVFEIDAWRVWLRTCAILSFVEFLPPPFDDMHYRLFGRMLRGSSEKLPQTRLMLHVLKTYAPQTLSRAFVAEHVGEKIKYEAMTMVRRLKSATAARIRALPWMQATTKHIAVKKVAAMRFQVAYPAEWYNEFVGINVDPERMLYNIWNLSTKDTNKMINSLGRGCGESDGTWDDGAFEVNAYYYPDKNLLTIPGGMLRPPFFDLSRSVAWNYGGIGAAIAHEITHGFDADGKNYDLHGNYREWWLATDNRKYEEMSQKLVDMYGGLTYFGARVDGRLTLSENIADLGGVSIALYALKDYLKEKRATPKEQLEAYQDFFTSYAVSWRNKDRPRKAKQSLLLDVHAPAPYRVNVVVRQFAEFYEAFGVKEGDEGWIDEADRVQLW